MGTLKKSIAIETAFDDYVLTELIGEGGAGRVYSGVNSEGSSVAVKVLTNQSTEKRRRFKNETAFLTNNQHVNIVTVIDHGVASTESARGPFYVMKRYSESLRTTIERKMTPDNAMKLYGQILDGVEAAHLKGVTHRDLKPENVLVDETSNTLAIADFGVASFTEENLHTLVDTSPATRLANFQYAAPEQRVPGQSVDQAADIYALGLILNEIFTGSVPHGTNYRLIASDAPEYSFLDQIVASMIRQEADQRLQSIYEIKIQILKYRAEAVTIQKLRELDSVVIPEGEVTDPLAHKAPKIISADYNNGVLSLELDTPVNNDWITALSKMGSYRSVMGVPPEAFRFAGVNCNVSCQGNQAQNVIDYFKEWLPKATSVLKQNLEQQIKCEITDRANRLAQQREAEKKRWEINQALKF